MTTLPTPAARRAALREALLAKDAAARLRLAVRGLGLPADHLPTASELLAVVKQARKEPRR